MSSIKDENANSTLLVMSEKLSLRRSNNNNNNNHTRARDARSRLLSDSSDELPKSILKNRSRIPTKRSVSECVDDLSQIMADLDITIDDLSKATGKFCPHKHYFDECEEDTCRRDDDEDNDGDDDEEDDGRHDNDSDDDDDDEKQQTEAGTKAIFNRNDGDRLLQHGKQRKCDRNLKSGDSADLSADKPKKSVRFDEKVYETYFIASRLYDRRCFAKYHSSTRHHPPAQKKQHQKKNKKNMDDHHGNKSDETSSSTCKLSKSQRAKQSKKDKKKRLNKKDDGHETSSDDQGYCSSTLHSFSD